MAVAIGGSSGGCGGPGREGQLPVRGARGRSPDRAVKASRSWLSRFGAVSSAAIVVLTGTILEPDKPWPWPLVAPVVAVAAGPDAKANYQCGVPAGDLYGHHP